MAKTRDKAELFAATEHEKVLLRRVDSGRQGGCGVGAGGLEQAGFIVSEG